MISVFYLPCGTINLSKLFNINWYDVLSYTVEAQDATGLTVAETPLMVLHTCNCVRIHFLNYMGAFDAVDFILVEKVHDPKSDQYRRPQTYPLDKSQHSVGRINITANDSYTVQAVEYGEKDMEWLDELADTPVAFMEWKGIQSQQSTLMPVVIGDAKKVNRKLERRFTYELNISFDMSNPRIPMRD